MTETLVHPLPSRSLLILSYWYPPAIGAAAERISSFARYLPENGWETHVLTAGRSTLPTETPGVTVHAVEDPFSKPRPVFGDFDPRQRPSRWKALVRPLVFPDRFLKWRQAAYPVGVDILRQKSFDCLLASFPPASVVDLALRIYRETQVRLILDLRDRWIGPGGYEPTQKRQLESHRTLEREAISRAAMIITVSDAMADAVAMEQGIDREKIIVIPNGYEPMATSTPQAPSPIATQSDEDAVVISHVGTVIARNRPDLFFDMIRRLKEDVISGTEPSRGAGDPAGDSQLTPANCPGPLKNIVFRFVGNLSRDYIREMGLDSHIQTTGLVPVGQARVEMQSADALLLLTGRYVGQWGYNAKLFEYIQTGRPVLCLEEESPSNDRELLERFVPDRSFFAPLGDAPALAVQLERLKDYLAGRPAAAMELDGAFRDFSRKAIAAELASNLDGLLGLTNDEGGIERT